MADTRAGQRLTERHRTQQVALRAVFLHEMQRLWPLLDPLRLDATAAAWLDLMLDLMIGFHRQSAMVSLTYYDRFRAAETGEDDYSTEGLADLVPLNLDAARGSLIATGPAHIKHQTMRGTTIDEATSTGLVLVSGSASRHVLNGGRGGIVTAAERDKRTVGWMRVTRPDCCYWCAMLASRGPVYKDKATAERATLRSETRAGLEYHDNCVCTAEPMYRGLPPEEWPMAHQDFLELWKDTKDKRKPGQSHINAFRAAYNARLTEVEIPTQRLTR